MGDTAPQSGAAAQKNVDAATPPLQNFVGIASANAAAAGQGYGNTLGGQSGAASSGASTLAGGINGPLSNSVGTAGGYGTSAGQAYASALAAQVQAAVNAAGALADQAMNNIAKIGLHSSPSRRTMKLGREVGEGYRLGILSSIPGATSAGGELATDTIDRMAGNTPGVLAAARGACRLPAVDRWARPAASTTRRTPRSSCRTRRA